MRPFEIIQKKEEEMHDKLAAKLVEVESVINDFYKATGVPVRAVEVDIDQVSCNGDQEFKVGRLYVSTEM